MNHLRQIGIGYIERIALYGSAVGGIALFTGTLSHIQTFFEKHRAVAFFALVLDVILFVIRFLAKVEEEHRLLRLRQKAKERRVSDVEPLS